MKSVKTLLLLLVCVCWSNAIHAETLTQSTNEKLVHLLNDFAVLAEVKKPPLAVRLIRLSDHGECDGTPQSCPKVILYIAVSGFDEYPEQKLYELPGGYSWEFIRWKSIPDDEGKDIFVVFELKGKEASINYDKGWWIDRIYEFRVNLSMGYYKEIRK